MYAMFKHMPVAGTDRVPVCVNSQKVLCNFKLVIKKGAAITKFGCNLELVDLHKKRERKTL